MWIANLERTRTLERLSETQFGVMSEVLMERAGLAVFDAVRQMLPEGGRLVFLCGKGHNGGDGFVTARLCHQHGYRVEVLVAAEANELVPAAQHMLKLCQDVQIEPLFPSSCLWNRRLESLHMNELIIDALLGIGGKSEVHGTVRQMIQAANRSGVPALAVDVPSGICCDSGEELGESIWALRTVTFGNPKPYLFQGTGLEHAGYWTVADIGYPQDLISEPTDARVIDGEFVANLLPERLKASHKGDNGHVLVVAGSYGMRGAAVLAAKSAYAAGAGLVTVASIPAVCDAVAHQLPEALLMPLPNIGGVIAPDAVEIIESEMHRFVSMLVGPGLTHHAPVLDFLSSLFAIWHQPAVIDADALNAIAVGISLPNCECVLTPHPGEMSRLMHQSIAEVQADRFRALAAAVRKTNQCVLLKGPYSIVAEPGQPLIVNSTGNPGQASAGMGDVLSGIIATLMAQDLPAYYAASCAMFWHGAAADLCAEEIGPVGYTASDVARALPTARARIVAACNEL